ncbi:hypothetical protein L6452_01679 [Arctium lappa]|uniref:Uncharacterized protein n=1 Tax=Arctium lappa TaxID=4217 RepID=A0ACB9FGS4_ARCLA|nr:hypothetical protein L6452_01679 [Arctium lappa]
MPKLAADDGGCHGPEVAIVCWLRLPCDQYARIEVVKHGLRVKMIMSLSYQRCGILRKRADGEVKAKDKGCTRLKTRERAKVHMVIPPPVKAQRITNYLKPYLLKMHFSNKYVSAQVIHAPTATVASAASSQEKALREAWNKAQQSTRDVAAAAKIGKLLGERLLLKDIPAVSVVYKREQRYHGKVRAVIDSLREAGVKLL